MSVNFEEIPHEIEVSQKPTISTRTVWEEISARQQLLQERVIKCKNIEPLYEKPKKRPHRYTYKYFCVCPQYRPQYTCKHSGNIVVNRDFLTSQEHLLYLSTPKQNVAAPRKRPRFYQKKFIVPNCTARINKLAAPDLKHVRHTLNHFKNLLTKRHKTALQHHLEIKPKVAYTDITTALEWFDEEKRLRKVAKRLEKMRCNRLSRKILHKQCTQIMRIIDVLFEEMKDFLLNDQFVIDDNSILQAVILEAIQKFTDEKLVINSNLKEYQKILAYNLSVWINKFISNLNIDVTEIPRHCQQQQTDSQCQRSTRAIESFLPVDDYIPCSSDCEDGSK